MALVGQSGSGKSTLVSLLPRFYDPSGGAVLLDGRDVREYSLRDLRRQLSLVSQDVVLFDESIANNIAYGALAGSSRADVERAAEAAYVAEFAAELPQGLDTRIGERGSLLSGGQRQRIAIARALLKDAPVLILDEATSALDTESERRIQAALAHLMHGRTTLVIAHRLSTIEKADRIVVLREGKIVETGNHAELMARARLLLDAVRDAVRGFGAVKVSSWLPGFEALWYRNHPLRWMLWPATGPYRLAAWLRREAYRRGWLADRRRCGAGRGRRQRERRRHRQDAVRDLARRAAASSAAVAWASSRAAIAADRRNGREP